MEAIIVLNMMKKQILALKNGRMVLNFSDISTIH
jgi:hypothetical protein